MEEPKEKIENEQEERTEGKGKMSPTAERTSPAAGCSYDESAVGKEVDPKEHQKEMMAQQPANRTQTKTDKAADRKDLGQ